MRLQNGIFAPLLPHLDQSQDSVADIATPSTMSDIRHYISKPYPKRAMSSRQIFATCRASASE